MPKKLSYNKVGDDKYEFENNINIGNNYTCFIRAPIELGRKLENKKLKITIEVIEE